MTTITIKCAHCGASNNVPVEYSRLLELCEMLGSADAEYDQTDDDIAYTRQYNAIAAEMRGVVASIRKSPSRTGLSEMNDGELISVRSALLNGRSPAPRGE